MWQKPKARMSRKRDCLGGNEKMTLQELTDKLAEAWGGVSERMENLAEALQKAFDEANRKIEEHKRLLRRPPKWYSKANTPAMLVSRRRVYHCRDKC